MEASQKVDPTVNRDKTEYTPQQETKRMGTYKHLEIDNIIIKRMNSLKVFNSYINVRQKKFKTRIQEGNESLQCSTMVIKIHITVSVGHDTHI